MICFPFLRQLSAPDVLFPGAPACTWNCMTPLLSFSPSVWRPWRFLPWSPYLHLKLHGASFAHFSVNLAPLTFSSLEPLLALETAWRPSHPFLRQFGAPDVFFLEGAPACTWNCMAPLSSFYLSIWRPWRFLPGSVACTWNCMAPLSSFSPSIWRRWLFFPGAPSFIWNCMAPLSCFSSSIWRPWRFLPWSPCLHLKLHGAPLVLCSVNLAPLTFSSLEPLLALETAWRPSLPYLRQFGAPDVFFPGAPACTWNFMAPLSSFSTSIWRPWRFLPWSPCLHLKFHGAPLVLFYVNLAPLTLSSWIPCLHLKLHGAPLVLCSVNLEPLPFFPWSPYFHLKLHGAPLVLFFVNWAPLMFSSLEPLLALETAWRISRPLLRQFGAPDVFFPGAPACTWNCMAPLSSFALSIWRHWHFLPWSLCLHLKLHGAPFVILI